MQNSGGLKERGDDGAQNRARDISRASWGLF
jgi:hypothetical protein